MAVSTLTSLAYLKVQMGQGRDYFDYLRPFVLQAVSDNSAEPITGLATKDAIHESFGLQIPERTVELVLRRIAREQLIRREGGVYFPSNTLEDPQLRGKISSANHDISAVLNGLIEFSKNTKRVLSGYDDATACVLAFLSEFSVTCLRSFLQGTTIPAIEGGKYSRIVLVSDYVRTLQATDSAAFGSFISVVQGHMLANALLCPDSTRVTKDYRRVKFFLDTPLLVHLLGLEGKAKQSAASDLVRLLLRLHGKVAVFLHLRDELEVVIRSAAGYLERPEGESGIVLSARRNGLTESDLLLEASTLDARLRDFGVEIVETPAFIEAFQIDESAFEEVLLKGIRQYRNPKALRADIESVRSIYVLRAAKPARSLERSRAILVTSNAAFARAAWKYGRNIESSSDVSSVITDFSLANVAWLKTPMDAPDLPATQALAFAYAALEPTRELLTEWVAEVDRLKEKRQITDDEYQMLRSDPNVYRELMHLTLGRKEALVGDTVATVLNRVTDEIRRESSEKLAAERRRRRGLERSLDLSRSRERLMRTRIDVRCSRKAKRLVAAASWLCGLTFLGGLLGATVGLRDVVPDWIIWATEGVIVFLTAANIIWGTTLSRTKELMEERLYRRFKRSELGGTGLEREEDA